MQFLKGGPGASGRVLPPVTGGSRVRVAVSSHCTGEGRLATHTLPQTPHRAGALWTGYALFFSFVQSHCHNHCLVCVFNINQHPFFSQIYQEDLIRTCYVFVAQLTDFNSFKPNHAKKLSRQNAAQYSVPVSVVVAIPVRTWLCSMNFLCGYML